MSQQSRVLSVEGEGSVGASNTEAWLAWGVGRLLEKGVPGGGGWRVRVQNSGDPQGHRLGLTGSMLEGGHWPQSSSMAGILGPALVVCPQVQGVSHSLLVANGLRV